MAHFLRRLSSIFSQPPHSLNQIRGIRVDVPDGNLERALATLQRKMQRSGMERLIKRRADYGERHMKNTEKKVLARKNLERRIQSQKLARSLQNIIVKKIRNL